MSETLRVATDVRHPQYDYMESASGETYTNDQPGVWTQMQDCFDGQRTIKARGQAYLPMSPGLRNQKDTTKANNSYLYYKHNASFPEVLRRFVSSMCGLWFQSETKYELPDNLAPIVESATTDDKTIHSVEWTIARSQAVEGRIGILCEPDSSQTGTVPPDLVVYGARSIINWQTVYDYLSQKERILPGFTRMYYTDGGTKYGAKFVVLDETFVDYLGDETIAYRVLALDFAGNYYTATFDENYNIDDFDPDYPDFENIIYPSIAGKKLKFIPFTVINSDTVGFDVRQPALKPVSDGALSIYNKDALLQQALQISAQPFVFFGGFSDDAMENIGMLGSTVSISSPQADSHVEYVESQGSAITPLREEIAAQYIMIEKFGVELMDSGTESGAALTIRVDVKTASLKEMALVRGEGMEDILINCILMMNPAMKREAANELISVDVNNEFKGEIASVEQLRIYLDMLYGKKLTEREYHDLLYKAGVVTEEDYDVRQSELERDANLTPLVSETGTDNE